MDFKGLNMGKHVIYNGRKYFLHSSQTYYYCGPQKGIYSRALHRQIWYDNKGAIPKGMHVHHKDGNTENNEISNFEILSPSEHGRLHSKENDPMALAKLAEIGRQFAKQWHGSPEGLEWHRLHAQNIKLGHKKYPEKQCEVCSKTFIPGRAISRFCSNNCKSQWRRISKKDCEERQCPNCGQAYNCNKYSTQKYCSRHCMPPPNPWGQKGRPTLPSTHI